MATLIALPALRGIALYVYRGGLGEPGAERFALTPGAVADTLALFITGEALPLWAMAALVAVGVLRRSRRLPAFSAVAALWLTVPFVVVCLSQPRHVLMPRYLLFLQPVCVLLLVNGVFESVALATRLAGRLLGPRLPSRAAAGVAAALVVLATGAIGHDFARATWTGYWTEKVNDWGGLCRYLRAHAGPADVVSGDWYFEPIFRWCYRAGGAPAFVPNGQNQPDRLIERGWDVWFVNVDPGSFYLPYLKTSYELVPRSEWRSPGLSPGIGADGRVAWFQSEQPATLFHYRSGRAAQAE
jgi:hypothetical protein